VGNESRNAKEWGDNTEGSVAFLMIWSRPHRINVEPVYDDRRINGKKKIA
jgi:hypothetical protein